MEESSTVRHFLGLRGAVAGGTTLNRVKDVYIPAFQTAGLDDFVEQLSGASHERLALLILVSTWGFADKAEPRARIPHAENRLLAGACQLLAPSALGNLGSDDVQEHKSVLPVGNGGLRYNRRLGLCSQLLRDRGIMLDSIRRRWRGGRDRRSCPGQMG